MPDSPLPLSAGAAVCVPQGAGCLSRRSHVGSRSGSGVGTNDPDKWQHLLWFDGRIFAAELLDDSLGHIFTYDELREHFDQWQNTGRSPWRRVHLPNPELK